LSETSEPVKGRHGSALSILSLKPQSEAVIKALKAIAVWEGESSELRSSEESIEIGKQDLTAWSSKDGSVFRMQVV